MDWNGWKTNTDLQNYDLHCRNCSQNCENEYYTLSPASSPCRSPRRSPSPSPVYCLPCRDEADMQWANEYFCDESLCENDLIF